MDNVQLENGYTTIANEILEQIARIKLSPTQYRLIFIIWRYTYGFKRKEHDLSLSFLSQATGCDKRQIQRELKELEERKVIIQKVTSGKGRKLSFNKYYSQWDGKTAIGQTTIGQIDNGEIDNTTIGEIDNTTIGETVKGTIGEIDNQERKTKTKFKENIKTNKELINQYTDNKDLIQTLLDFIETRKQLKKPMNDRALKLCFKELDKYGLTDETKIQMVEQSIMRGWSGVFPLKEQYKNNYNTKIDTSKGVMHGGEIINFNAFSKNG